MLGVLVDTLQESDLPYNFNTVVVVISESLNKFYGNKDIRKFASGFNNLSKASSSNSFNKSVVLLDGLPSRW